VRVLLDTHTFLWWISNDTRLSSRAREIISNGNSLPIYHRDPFDRIIIAQAQLEGLPILTSDPQIAKYKVEIIW